jgi:hypothetical protein
MYCCARRAALCGLATFAFSLGSAAHAQAARNFPANALRGAVVFTQPPAVLLNGRLAQLAPGARIRGADNMLLMSGAIVGARVLVHYTLDLQGNLLDVWLLNAAEAERKPWPTTPAEAAAWRFNADAQMWSRP